MENNIIMLSTEHRNALEQFIKTGVHSARLITRARVILALDRSTKKDHLRINRICEQVGVSRQALYDIRDAFLKAENVEAFLTRKKRETPPVPPKLTGDVEARIIALACSKPPDGCSKWCLRLLSERSVELGFCDSLSHMSVSRVLKKHNISLT